jgi:hypothetical protein
MAGTTPTKSLISICSIFHLLQSVNLVEYGSMSQELQQRIDAFINEIDFETPSQNLHQLREQTDGEQLDRLGEAFSKSSKVIAELGDKLQRILKDVNEKLPNQD